jgi:hypothetical protein
MKEAASQQKDVAATLRLISSAGDCETSFFSYPVPISTLAIHSYAKLITKRNQEKYNPATLRGRGKTQHAKRQAQHIKWFRNVVYIYTNYRQATGSKQVVKRSVLLTITVMYEAHYDSASTVH